MAASAPQVQYRQEMIKAFEKRQSLYRQSVTTEAVIKGNTATFLIAGSNGESAVTRGISGLIPARANTLTQTSATLTEEHDLRRETNFNIFQSQGNLKEVMQMNTVAVINRRIDDQIVDALDSGTQYAGATAVTADLGLVMRAKTILGVGQVPFDGNIFFKITPAFEAYLMQVKEFSSREYVGKQPFDAADPAWRDQVREYYWLGAYWCVDPTLPGVGTSSETCFAYHKSAIGHAVNTEGMDVDIGYDGEQNYSWARASMFMGAVKLQNTGIVKILHDGSAFAAT